MSQQNDVGFVTFTAGEALAAFRQVKLDSANDRQVVYAGAGEKGVGVTQEVAANAAKVTVKLWGAPGTFKVQVNEATTANCFLYSAASGYLADTASGDKVAYGLDAASATGAVIEAIPVSAALEAGAAAVASIDDNSGGTTGGTELLNPTATARIDDDSGGTTGGTEHYVDVLATQTGEALTKQVTLGGTTGGTPALVKINTVGGTSAQSAQIRNNLRVVAELANQNRADIATLTTAVNNNLKVTSTQLNLILTRTNNNLAVLGNRINAILTALRAAGLMAS